MAFWFMFPFFNQYQYPFLIGHLFVQANLCRKAACWWQDCKGVQHWRWFCSPSCACFEGWLLIKIKNTLPDIYIHKCLRIPQLLYLLYNVFQSLLFFKKFVIISVGHVLAFGFVLKRRELLLWIFVDWICTICYLFLFFFYLQSKFVF